MRFILLLFAMLPMQLLAQINIDFESADLSEWTFSTEGRWAVSTDQALSGSYSLRHIYDNPEAGRDMASINIHGLQPGFGSCSWEFKLRHAFDPSSQNRWGVFISSDRAASDMLPGSDVLAYAIGVNLKGSDDTLRLWKLRNGNIDEVITSDINWQADIGTDSIVSIIVTRDMSGDWQLLLKDKPGSEIMVGSGYDPEIFPVNYFGVFYDYTSSRDRAMWIDDIVISGVFVEDITAPSIVGAEFISNSCLQIRFSEAISGNWQASGNYSLSPGNQQPENVVLDASGIICLYFSRAQHNKTAYYLRIDTLSDISGNIAVASEIECFLNMPEWGDVIITEFMSDPFPSVGLGDFEYLEIYNRSAHPVNLRSLSILNGDSKRELTDCCLASEEYIVLCDAGDTSLLTPGIKYTVIESFPVLNNSSGMILICDSLYKTIHGINYNSSWFDDGLKKEGGWSMEIRDVAYPFSGRNNWAYTFDPSGGTPGKKNSVFGSNPDTDQPLILSIYAGDIFSVILKFSEPVTDLAADPDLLVIDNIDILAVSRLDSLRSEYRIDVNEALLPGQIYTGLFNNIRDCAGNNLLNSYPRFGLFAKACKGDIVLNEILFNPIASGEEYIELFNNSSSIINAADLRFVSRNTHSGDTGQPVMVSDEPLCILPGAYYAISEAPENVLNRYNNSDRLSLHKSDNLPSLPNDEAEILLYNKDLNLLDNFHYKDSYHFDLISGTAGVSLERIDPALYGSLASNWHSASGMSGWGTPGILNSVTFETDSADIGSLWMSSGRISPDNDGYEDILKISIIPGKGTYLLNVIIYDDQGYKLNHLVKNQTAYGKESFYWDGCDQYGKPLPSGIYIIYVRSISESSGIKEWKKVCAILRR